MAAYGDIVNQKRVLTSYDMINRTLDKLDYDVSYYNIGRFRTQQIYGKRKIPFTVSMDVLNTKLYEKPFDMTILDVDRFTLSYDPGAGIVTKEFRFNTDIADGDFVLRVDRSPEVSERNIHRFTESAYRFIRHWQQDNHPAFPGPVGGALQQPHDGGERGLHHHPAGER